MSQQIQFRQEFLFLRHGQTDWNVQGRLQGRSDRALNANGIAQVRSAAERLPDEKVSFIVSSPLTRARQTASILAERLDIPVNVEPQLIERNFGSLEGLLLSEIVPDRRMGLDVASSTTLPSDAEPWDQVCTRVLCAIEKWLSEYPTERVLFVSHYGVMSALCEQLCGTLKPAKDVIPYRFVPNEYDWKMVEVRGK